LIKSDNLKTFIGSTISFLGHGYTTFKIVSIPQKKIHKKAQILQKIEKNYQTKKTRSQRAYAKKKNRANFGAVCYNNTIIILHTKGEIDEKIDYGKGWYQFKEKTKIELNLSDYTSIIIFRDERKKITARLSKIVLEDVKNRINEALKKRDKKALYAVLSSFRGYPLFRGIVMQKKALKEWLRLKLKDQNYKNFIKIPKYL